MGYFVSVILIAVVLLTQDKIIVRWLYVLCVLSFGIHHHFKFVCLFLHFFYISCIFWLGCKYTEFGSFCCEKIAGNLLDSTSPKRSSFVHIDSLDVSSTCISFGWGFLMEHLLWCVSRTRFYDIIVGYQQHFDVASWISNCLRCHTID